MDLHDAGMQALVGRLADDVRPPAHHRVEDAEDARPEHVGADAQAAGREALHDHDEADRHDEGGGRADEGPRARVDEVVVVVLPVRVGVTLGHSCSSVPRSVAVL
jgi:hypothetical protein